METKSHIRKEVFAARKAATDSEIHENSRKILKKLLSLTEYKEASFVFVYVDAKHEVETMDFIRQCLADNKRVAAPRVKGETMDYIELVTLEQLKPGYFGILEPCEGEVVEWPEALLLMPGVAFDKKCHRVGYGGGFYDRYLEKYPHHPTVAIAFDFQMRDEVPFEETDICPQKIITETAIYELGK